MRLTLFVYKCEVPCSEDRKERGNDKDKNPADKGDQGQDGGNDTIDDSGNNERDEREDVRKPSHCPNPHDDLRIPDTFADAPWTGKPDGTKNPKQHNSNEEDELHEKEEEKEQQKNQIWHCRSGGKVHCERKGDPRCEDNEDGQEPEEPHDSELDTIDKKICPPGEVGGRFYPTVDPDNIARDKEREDETDSDKDRDPAPRDRTLVDGGASHNFLRIEDEPDEREREGEDYKDRPPCPFSYERFLWIGEWVWK